ncbi:MAG: Ferric reductase transmembrane domain-containing protein [Candidatus Moranbacteria bacterium GW2011_GWD2_36_12]|nr:MAG: Ferric reductase transmembrane domain-containing protein [Candidatus Moranbacteria bacterium GW2011_GWD2_36_12]KKQ04975.1 MAG: Ferric reductase transmembrane domain-containing protein [Candidatus Moranbacteria bacterium GW2011_GWE2_36_40]
MKKNRMENYGKKIMLVAMFFLMFSFWNANAQQDTMEQQPPQVDYQGQPPVDYDLDGLTDQAEIQIYKTDPKNPDTDGDGYYDGTETVSLADPLDAAMIPGIPITEEPVVTNDEVPWAWYVSRASGLVAFLLLYLSIFFGLVIRVPFVHKIFSPLGSMQAHGWIALQALFFAFIHGVVLIFDKFINLSLWNIFVPFSSSYEPTLLALGTISLYLMIILIVTSYGRKYMSQKIWRAIHFSNIFLYVFTIVHALMLGTDLKNEVARNIFIYANAFLILFMFVNMFVRIRKNIIRRNSNNVENINTVQ